MVKNEECVDLFSKYERYQMQYLQISYVLFIVTYIQTIYLIYSRRNISDISHQPPRVPGHVSDVAAFSVPTSHHWDNDSPGLASPEYSSSLSSVEEATEFTSAGYHSARRKTFNHLDIDDHDQNSVTKSPRFLPKFLRTSFSKLLKDKPTSKHDPSLSGLRRDGGYLRTWTVSTPVSRSPSINLDKSDLDADIYHQPRAQDSCDGPLSPQHSPTTGQFIQDCLAKGLPIIPFNYSTAEIVEKRRQSQRRKAQENMIRDMQPQVTKTRDTGPESPVERTPAPEWSDADMTEDKSLEGLLTLARREMEQEAQLRKVSPITCLIINDVHCSCRV